MKAHFSSLDNFFKTYSDEFCQEKDGDGYDVSLVSTRASSVGFVSAAPEQTVQVEKQKEKDAIDAAIKALVKEVRDTHLLLLFYHFSTLFFYRGSF